MKFEIYAASSPPLQEVRHAARRTSSLTSRHSCPGHDPLPSKGTPRATNLEPDKRRGRGGGMQTHISSPGVSRLWRRVKGLRTTPARHRGPLPSHFCTTHTSHTAHVTYAGTCVAASPPASLPGRQQAGPRHYGNLKERHTKQLETARLDICSEKDRAQLATHEIIGQSLITRKNQTLLVGGRGAGGCPHSRP